jgi:hypothetical protein
MIVVILIVNSSKYSGESLDCGGEFKFEVSKLSYYYLCEVDAGF